MANDLYIPVVFREYKIRVSDAPVVGRLPLLGHVGALTLDSQSGVTGKTGKTGVRVDLFANAPEK